MSKRGEDYGQFVDLMELIWWLGESAYGFETVERFGVTRRTAELMLEAVNKAIYFGGDFEEQQEDEQKYFKLFLLPPSKNEPGGSMP
jgi:hypothetical protein